MEVLLSGPDWGGNGYRGSTRKWYFALGKASKMAIVLGVDRSSVEAGRAEAGCGSVAYVRKAEREDLMAKLSDRL